LGLLSWRLWLTVLVHEKSVFRSAEVREEGCEVGPGFRVCGKRLVHVEWDVVDEGEDAAIIKVHGVDDADCDTANTIDDDIVFVASVGVDRKVAGTGDAIEDGAGVLCCVE
jgi:hypothetical protein